MKPFRYFVLPMLLFAATSTDLNAQIKPSGTNAPAGATANSVPGAYGSGIKVNYVCSRDAIAPISDATVFDTAGYRRVRQSTQYLDGLGRPLQTVTRQTTPALKDVVSPVLYDTFGREPYKYLPYADTGSYGNFKMNPFNTQAGFMYAQYPNESIYYSETRFEASPLDRVTKILAAGNNWEGNDRGVSTQYLLNETSDSVRIWTIGNDTLTGSSLDQSTNTPVISSVYAAGTLYEMHVVDEHGKHVVEYKDKDGRIILKKIQLDSSPGTGHIGWLCTYYVYDDYGMLRFVIPPKAVAALLAAGSWDLTIGSYNLINELCFRYEYDSHNRMTAKKIPGAGWVYMVYDRRDRLAYIQDANMRSSGKWMATLYDELNRPVSTGMISYSDNRGALQWLLNSHFDAASSTTFAVNFAAPDSLYVSTRETGKATYRAVNQIVFTGEFTTEDGAETETILAAATLSTASILLNYDPFPPAHNFIALTYNFYDDYAFTSKAYGTAHNGSIDDGGNAYPESLPSSASLLTYGLATGSRVRVLSDPADLGSGAWMENASFFDDKGRVIQLQSENYTNGTDTTTTRYDFTGKAITAYQVHNNAIAGVLVRTKTNMLYDHAGRLLNIKKTINDDGNTTRYLLRNSYDELGQLIQKREGQQGQTDTTAMEVLDNTYNIRGWLQGINRDYSRGSGTRWFGMELNYDWGFTASQYNGNISGQQWRSRGDGERRAMGYDYDAANCILSGDFTQYTSSTWNTSAGLDFTLSNMSYDANGNILTMNQKGWKIGGSALIDQLAYTYNANSNKLLNVVDAQNDAGTVLGDFRSSSSYMSALGGSKTSSATDYTYDDNGNLLKDRNKDIGGSSANGIVYNHLNLPYQVAVTGKGTITYYYDALGNKLEKRTAEGSLSTKTTYSGGYVYRNDTLQFLPHEEGRIRRKADGSYVYDYFVKDHLGNTRVVLTEEQQVDPYPAVSLEDGALTTDTFYYRINAANIVANPASLPSTYANNNGNPPYNTNPNINTSATSTRMYKLNGSTGDKTGLNIALKVMAGDQVAIYGKSYWHSNGSSPNNSYTTVVNDLLTALAGTTTIVSAGKGAAAAALIGSAVTPSDVSSLLGSPPTVTGRPNAYINWILFDEQFRVVSSNSGFDPVNTSADALKSHTQGVSISKSGYLYVYCSNESNQDVFFDNLQVIHTRGPLLEETHYYPFGLTMAGISSKAAGKMENRYKYNGGNELQSKEFTDGSGLELYDAVHRLYDPQIGRFGQIDKLADIGFDFTPYGFAKDNPILLNDPSGLKEDTASGKPLPEFVGKPVSTKRYQEIKWFGGQSLKIDTHLEGNYNQFFARIRGGQDILQKGDRYSYIDGVLNGSLLDKYTREQEAQEMEEELLLIYATAVTLPEDIVATTGLIGKGIKLFTRGGRVFWSGGLEVAGKAAADYAKANGMKTLEMTVKGRILTVLTKLKGFDAMKPAWEKASASFAAGARGTVHVFQNATEGVRLDGIWRNIEYPNIRSDVNIIFHDVFK